MLATPLPGLIISVWSGPGATNGPLTAQTLGSYSNDPHQVEHLFDQYSAESGFAGWIKTWQDSTGRTGRGDRDQVPPAGEATTNAQHSSPPLQVASPGEPEVNVASIPGATAFTINEPATHRASVTIPAQQVQAVVFADGKY